MAGVFAPLAERTLLHAPRSVEQGPLRGVQHPRFNDPPPRGVRKGPKALPSKDFKKRFFPSAQHFYGIKKKSTFPLGPEPCPWPYFPNVEARPAATPCPAAKDKPATSFILPPTPQAYHFPPKGGKRKAPPNVEILALSRAEEMFCASNFLVG